MGKNDDILWAPWRIEYIKSAHKDKGCIFCSKPRENDDRKNLILCRGEQVYVIMNRYPYNNGHLMIVPYKHTADPDDLSPDEIVEMFELLRLSRRALTDTMRPQGFNIGMNLGRLAGAGITDHLHFHIVPRWGGDTNFMPVVGHTKVISEALEETWKNLKQAMDRTQNSKT